MKELLAALVALSPLNVAMLVATTIAFVIALISVFRSDATKIATVFLAIGQGVLVVSAFSLVFASGEFVELMLIATLYCMSFLLQLVAPYALIHHTPEGKREVAGLGIILSIVFTLEISLIALWDRMRVDGAVWVLVAGGIFILLLLIAWISTAIRDARSTA